MSKRTFVIVVDSLGIGSDERSYLYGDDGANTLKHMFEATDGKYKIPTLRRLGLCNLCEVKGNGRIDHPAAYITKMHEASIGKDTMTGHWEMMGLWINSPFVSFTETGFPKELMDRLEKETGHKFIGNYAASGTEILKELGERHMKTGELIIYTSADSVLQIAAHEEVTGLEELYRVCEIARKITLERDDWKVGRIIARPFIGSDKDHFTRTPNRHDYTVSPYGKTVLNSLKDAGRDVISIGKISDIFKTEGITKAIHSDSSHEGMLQTIDVCRSEFDGLCFVNLVDFDAKWGHRRNPEGYANELQDFDGLLSSLLDELKDEDILMITADHGNDPTWSGTDHTREFVPLIVYSKSFKGSGHLALRDTFADIGATVSERHEVENLGHGTSFLKELI